MVQNIKQGDGVVYLVGGVEYNAIALGSPNFGMNPGLRAANFHLNLIYLNEQGIPITIMGAPLLTAAATDEEKQQILVAEVKAKPALVSVSEDAEKSDRQDAVVENIEAHKARLVAAPCTIGWRPVVGSYEMEALNTEPGSARVERDAYAAKIAGLEAGIAKLNAELLAAPAQAELDAAHEFAEGLRWKVADLTALVESQQAILNQKPEPAQTTDDGKPSAADLDAVAAEQKASGEGATV